jgi:hypothetical protein
VALTALQIPVDQRPHGQQNLAYGVGEALLELRRDAVAQGGQHAQQQVQLTASQTPSRTPVGSRLLPAGRGHVGRTVATATGITPRTGITTATATAAGTRTGITTGIGIATNLTTGTGPTTGTGSGTATRAGSGHGIAKQPLGSGRSSVQTLLQTAECVRVGVRTLSHQT